jgi:hypothetical protein
MDCLELDVVVVVVVMVPSVVPLALVLVLPSLILTFSSLAFFTTLRPEPTLNKTKNVHDCAMFVVKETASRDFFILNLFIAGFEFCNKYLFKQDFMFKIVLVLESWRPLGMFVEKT